jgi:hypothetical protein
MLTVKILKKKSAIFAISLYFKNKLEIDFFYFFFVNKVLVRRPNLVLVLIVIFTFPNTFILHSIFFLSIQNFSKSALSNCSSRSGHDENKSFYLSKC